MKPRFEPVDRIVARWQRRYKRLGMGMKKLPSIEEMQRARKESEERRQEHAARRKLALEIIQIGRRRLLKEHKDRDARKRLDRACRRLKEAVNGMVLYYD